MSRIALAESVGGGFREAPGWMALPSLTVPKGDSDASESDQVFLFAGLGMTRLWVLHARAPTGVGARHVALGLCEHLVGAWAGAAVDKDIPQVQREEILSYTQLDPQLDRPLLPAQEDPGTPPLFKQGKARMAFDMYEMLAGASAWRDTLLSWSQGTARGARIETLLDRMGGTAEKDAFLDAFFRRQGASQVSITDVQLVALPPDEAARLQLDAQAWKRVEITIDNAGLGPVPVDVQVQIDQAVRHERVIAPSYGRVVLQLVAGNLPSRIRLDPQRILWQSRGDDDAWPAFKHEKRDEFDGAVTAGGRGDASSADTGRDKLRGE